MFRVGQKVVCVDASLRGLPHCLLRRGEIYQIVHIAHDGCLDVGHDPVAALCVAYKSDRFRPLIEKSTDAGMAILKEILDRETIDDSGSPVVSVPNNDEGMVP